MIRTIKIKIDQTDEGDHLDTLIDFLQRVRKVLTDDCWIELEIEGKWRF